MKIPAIVQYLIGFFASIGMVTIYALFALQEPGITFGVFLLGMPGIIAVFLKDWWIRSRAASVKIKERYHE